MPTKSSMIVFQEEIILYTIHILQIFTKCGEVVQPALHYQQPSSESKPWQSASIFSYTELAFITRIDSSAYLEEDLEIFLKKYLLLL